MARLKFGSIITSASGKLGGQIIAIGKNGAYIKNHSARVKKSSLSQNNIKASTGNLTQIWSDLSQLQLKLWQREVIQYPYYDKFDDKRYYSPFILFQKLNQGRIQAGLSILSVPNATHIPTLPQMVDVTATTSELVLQSEVYDSDDVIQVFATRSLSTGISNPLKEMRQIAILSSSQLSLGYDAINDYLAVFQPLLENQQIWLGLKTISSISGYSYPHLLINKPAVVVQGAPPPSYDPDAQAFIDAVGTLTTAQEVAINNLVLAFKSNGTWSTYQAIYPFIGGTAAAHKWNLKDPRDLDAAFRLSFNGGFTHDANGAMGNGSTGYADSFYIPSANQSSNAQHLSVYINSDNTATAPDPIEFGVDTADLSILIVKNGGSMVGFANSTLLEASNSDARGLFQLNRISTTATISKNAVVQDSDTGGGSLPTNSVYLWNLNLANTPYSDGYSNQRFAFASLGTGQTQTQRDDDLDAIEAYQVELGRNN